VSEPLVLSRRDGAVVVLRFNDPERRNAMTEAMGGALAAEIAELSRDEAVRAVVLTGAGRAFSAGGDLAMIEAKGAAGRADPGAADFVATRCRLPPPLPRASTCGRPRGRWTARRSVPVCM
jgi:enoyl-CoA hydratase/carnithine racemase